MGKQVKSKQRVSEHGEVFTAEREVKAMCDLVADECLRIDSRFLEPACGEGNFLLEILSRKMSTVELMFPQHDSEYQRNSLIAVSSIYGIDILLDNVEICREKLFSLWNKDSFSEDLRKSARKILELNIICGDTLKYIDNSGNDITFSEWLFFDDKIRVQRNDYDFRTLVEDDSMFRYDPKRLYKPVEYWRIHENV